MGAAREAALCRVCRRAMRFPHIYGPINLDAVIQVLDFEPDENGDFTLPTSLNRGG